MDPSNDSKMIEAIGLAKNLTSRINYLEPETVVCFANVRLISCDKSSVMVSAPMLASVSDSLAVIMKSVPGDSLVISTQVSSHNLELFRQFVMTGTVSAPK